jgi:hypothetical protein
MTAGDVVFVVLSERDSERRLRCCQYYARTWLSWRRSWDNRAFRWHTCRSLLLVLIATWSVPEIILTFTPWFEEWNTRCQVHGVVLMLKHRQFSQGLKGVFRPALSMKKYFACTDDPYEHVRRGYFRSGLPHSLIMFLQYVPVSDHCIFR